MFGCELPVAAMSFPALPELVKDGENGLVFKNSEQLAEVHWFLPHLLYMILMTVLQILVSWFQDFPGFPGSSRHRGFRENLAEFRQLGWKENWNKVLLASLQLNLINVPPVTGCSTNFQRKPTEAQESRKSDRFSLRPGLCCSYTLTSSHHWIAACLAVDQFAVIFLCIFGFSIGKIYPV